MKRRHRLLSVLVVLLLGIGCMPLSASAASLPYIKVSTYQNNAQAKQVLQLINKERSKRGLGKLKLDKQLTDAAVKRAAEVSIYVPRTSPHKRPNGKIAKTVFKRVNNECCAEGYASPKGVVHGWITSKTHRKLILDKKAKSIGIGCITTDGADTFWTLELSYSKAKKKLSSSKKVHSYKKVYAKKKLLKKSYFSLRPKSSYSYYEDEGPTMIPGQKETLRVYYSSSYNYNYNSLLAASDFKWSSSNTSVAVVSKKGVVTAKADGYVKITAKMKRSPHHKITIWIDVVKEGDLEDDF